ncbi:MAG: methyltransferase domain-containing protein [Nitrospira sp.]
MASTLDFSPSQAVVLVNLACGSSFHPAWRNFDVMPVSPDVAHIDLRRSLPFEDESVDVCYASHVLEHLTRNDARALLAECFRVTKHEGIIRLVVPDLASVAREYIRILEEVERGLVEARHKYEWIVIELLDQLVRHDSGGDMGRYLIGHRISDVQFAVSRIGLEAEPLIDNGEGCEKTCKPRQRRRLSHYLRRLREEMVVLLAALFLGTDGTLAVREGLFRRSGEVHRWMYDRYSLRELLETAGFQKVQCCGAAESRIPGFQEYQLDTVNGRVRKPDSLFIEAIKPS